MLEPVHPESVELSPEEVDAAIALAEATGAQYPQGVACPRCCRTERDKANWPCIQQPDPWHSEVPQH